MLNNKENKKSLKIEFLLYLLTDLHLLYLEGNLYDQHIIVDIN